MHPRHTRYLHVEGIDDDEDDDWLPIRVVRKYPKRETKIKQTSNGLILKKRRNYVDVETSTLNRILHFLIDQRINLFLFLP